MKTRTIACFVGFAIVVAKSATGVGRYALIAMRYWKDLGIRRPVPNVADASKAWIIASSVAGARIALNCVTIAANSA